MLGSTKNVGRPLFYADFWLVDFPDPRNPKTQNRHAVLHEAVQHPMQSC